jgi:transposase
VRRAPITVLSAPVWCPHQTSAAREEQLSLALTETDSVGGVDTHTDSHTVAALSGTGQLLSTAQFPATPDGYQQLLAWQRGFGRLVSRGVEGTGSYGAGLHAYLRQASVEVREVIRPKRQVRRRRGKSDPVDAEAAARAVIAGDDLGTPKRQDGGVEALRVLRLARRSALKARTQAANQLHAIIQTAPSPLRERLRSVRLPEVVKRVRRFRCAAPTTPMAAARFALRSLAERWAALDSELQRLDEQLTLLVHTVAAPLLAVRGVGVDTAGALLVAAGDNPERLSSEASFAALCGVSPVDASSGRQHRHRLNRGGNRDANRALWVIAIVRMASDPATQSYVQRRTHEGLSKKEILRCLKRYIARQLYRLLLGLIAVPTMPPTALDNL